MDNNSSFEDRLKQASQKNKPTTTDSTPSKENMGQYARLFHIGSEIIGGVIAGLLLGLSLDYFLKTKSLFTPLLAVLGIFIGLYNAYRYFMKITQADEPLQDEKAKKKIDENTESR